MTKESKLTGYPLIDKPWLKYYSNEEVSAELPQSTLYQHIKNKNFDNCKRIAINYYGNNIKYESFFSQIDTTASALEALGVKENDSVTVCMINSPETIVLMFALNKIGATANMVALDKLYCKLSDDISKNCIKTVIILPVYNSMA